MREHFIRVCMEINLSQPLVGRFTLDHICYRVEYQGLYTICFVCGSYSRHNYTCPIVLTQRMEENPSRVSGDTLEDLAPMMDAQRSDMGLYCHGKRQIR